MFNVMHDVIDGFYGLPGTGKTTVMSATATAALSGRYFLNVPPKKRVFSNVPIPGTYELTYEMIGRDDLSNSLILIDEACQWFDSRQFKTFPKEVSNFFQTIRHEHSSVCMFYQAFNDVDSRLRSLCQMHYILKSLPFDLTLIKPVEHVQDIFNYKPDDRYQYAPWYDWRILRRSKYYHLFDSFIRFQHYKKPKLVLYPGENDLVKTRSFSLFKKSVENDVPELTKDSVEKCIDLVKKAVENEPLSVSSGLEVENNVENKTKSLWKN